MVGRLVVYRLTFSNEPHTLPQTYFSGVYYIFQFILVAHLPINVRNMIWCTA